MSDERQSGPEESLDVPDAAAQAPDGSGEDGEDGEHAQNDESTVATDAEVAEYIAARGFVWSAWTGAVILTWSYAQLYLALLANVYSTRAAFVVGLLSLILGGVMFVRSRKFWLEMGGNVQVKSMTVALIFAGAGAVFWLLFLLLVILFYAGVELLPEP